MREGAADIVLKGATPLGRAAWAFYDWANSAYTTVIVTFVFAAYYAKAVAADEVTGTAQWGWAMSASAFAIAIAGPILGSAADRMGRRKPWLALFTFLCVAVTALLWRVKPDGSLWLEALVLVGISNFAFEMGIVFYNAMLPGLVPRSRIGRLSGWAWGLGYIGGLACLVAALLGFVQAEVPWFGVGKEDAANIRATVLLTAAWMGVFSLPIFFLTPDAPSSGVKFGRAVRDGLATLKRTLIEVRQYKDIARFLIARMIYTDGLNTLYAFGGIYAAGTFGLSFTEIIYFGIAMNVTAGLGAAAFGWIDDWIGPKKTVLISLIGLSVLGAGVLVVESKLAFWILGVSLGIFVGPAQAASRSYMAHLSPKHMETEMFGLYALSGKATAFLGPALLGWVTLAMDSQRWGMATILAFFLVGGVLLMRLGEPTRD